MTPAIHHVYAQKITMSINVDHQPDLLSVEGTIVALKVLYNSETDAELAKHLDISPTAISAWRKRNKIPKRYTQRFARTIPKDCVGKHSIHIQTIRLVDAYAFALVALASIKLATEINIEASHSLQKWAGRQLNYFYDFVFSALGQAAKTDSDSIRQTYQSLKSELESKPIAAWLDEVSPGTDQQNFQGQE